MIFSAQNHKHKHKFKHDHKHKHKNSWHKCQIYDFPFQNHKHKHKHKLTLLRRTEPKKKKKKKMEIVERGREAMGKEDERGRGLCDNVRLVTTRTKWSWESRELCLCLTTCGLVAVWVRELRDEEGKAAVWDCELKMRGGGVLKRREVEVWGCEKWGIENFRVYNYIYIYEGILVNIYITGLGLGSGRVLEKNPDPLRVFFF